MDGDPTVEPEFDSFSLILPLPYRIAVIFVLGIWAWGCNLQYLRLVRIDVPALIKYPQRSSHAQPPHYLSTYRLASFLTIPLLVSLVLFWLFTRGNPELVEKWQILPNLYLLLFPLAFLLPMRTLSHSGRYRTLTTLRRVSIGGIAQASDGKFGDILMADVLTSYAKVFGDLFVAICMIFTRNGSTALPDRACGGQFVVPFIISIPSLIRLRQCLIEYGRVRKSIATGAASPAIVGWGGQHLGNALKYSSAFPVIILSALQRGNDPANVGMTDAGLFHLWLFSVFVNSFYSFYWDVARDWDLTLFDTDPMARHPPIDPVTRAPEYPLGLRRHRYFQSSTLYYVVIVGDLLLRCTWSFKLSPHLDHFNDLEGGIFVMELLEVFRRWVWVFFRVETEWVRNFRGPAGEELLLGDYDGKIDDD